ncbi:SET domain protein [Ichthyophthirius multifiliis]|uniref:SET domain protein n=1 Tax=Ichthyophthirius multifiliis TaxID=5932 RepID=G0QJF9_ICHMU|nr:SET domain protein [Ichthyophthirius multifiliis]EGR34646.1 SET domain protein [Ichthyophthirius multifiliis]|eukprot:XP_004039950.1 SET domain protein [Ichthyophthirius multifiliis]
MMGGELPDLKIFRIQENYQETNVIEFMGYIRFILIRDQQKLLLLSNLQEQQQENNDSKFYKPKKTPPISIQNEIDMWNKINQVCQNQMQLYKTNIEEDNQLLQDNNLTLNQRNCVLLRLGEKDILRFYIEMSQKMITLLKLNRKEIKKVYIQGQYIKYNSYINKVIIQTLLQVNNE